MKTLYRPFPTRFETHDENEAKRKAFPVKISYVCTFERTVPTIVTAHLEILEFPMCGAYYADKAELSKCFWYPKRKLGVTMHFSEIMKLQFGKKLHTLLCILLLFRTIVL